MRIRHRRNSLGDGRKISGPFRRAIALRRKCSTVSFGWLEDDFHHFGVRITHTGNVITHVHAVTRRAPWSTCPAAEVALRDMEAQELRERASDIGRMIDMRRQCTHMFDLAGLVMAFAWRGDHARDYLAEVPVRPLAYRDGLPFNIGFATATLLRDGISSLTWHIEGSRIVETGGEPGPSLNRGFREWTEKMPVAEAEQAFVLRRAVMVAAGRGMDLDRFDTASQAPLPPVCHTFRGDLETTRRWKGSTLDYGNDMSDLLSMPDIVP